MDQDNTTYDLTAEAEAASQLSILQRGGAELPELFTREILLMETMVNGAMHVENIHELAAELHPGDPVKLVLEPDNPHDPRAILVRDQHDRKLGYIPRIKNEVLYHLMDAGKYLYGRVTGGDIGEKADPDSSWVEIYIAVYMQD